MELGSWRLFPRAWVYVGVRVCVVVCVCFLSLRVTLLGADFLGEHLSYLGGSPILAEMQGRWLNLQQAHPLKLCWPMAFDLASNVSAKWQWLKEMYQNGTLDGTKD